LLVLILNGATAVLSMLGFLDRQLLTAQVSQMESRVAALEAAKAQQTMPPQVQVSSSPQEGGTKE
jgi:hypothetical protein